MLSPADGLVPTLTLSGDREGSPCLAVPSLPPYRERLGMWTQALSPPHDSGLTRSLTTKIGRRLLVRRVAR